MGLRSEEALKKIEARLQSIDPNNRKVVHVFKFKIRQNGAVVKIMMLDLVNVRLYEGDDDAECTITLDDDALADMILKKVDPMQGPNKDKIEIDGNTELWSLLRNQISSV